MLVVELVVVVVVVLSEVLLVVVLMPPSLLPLLVYVTFSSVMYPPWRCGLWWCLRQHNAPAPARKLR